MSIILIVLIAIAMIAGVIAFEGAVIMWLWNWLAVALFSANPISFMMDCGIGIALSVVGSFFRSSVKINSNS